jgi:hypothetical protein
MQVCATIIRVSAAVSLDLKALPARGGLSVTIIVVDMVDACLLTTFNNSCRQIRPLALAVMG